jgi:predicted O-methyltransferase YrrM
MNFFHASKYVEHLILSQNRKGHGIHSPFVFDLVSRIFRNKTGNDVVCSIEKIRKQLISDRREITVNDLGSGPAKRKKSIRKVSDIAKYSAIPAKYGRLMYNMASEFGKNEIVEFGTSLGISTMYLASGAPSSKVYTMEGCAECAKIAAENFNTAGLDNITLMTGAFESSLPILKGKNIKPGLVFIDGNHKREPVLSYFNEMAEISGNETVIVIDDIYDSPGMEEAWNEIKKHPRVSVTVDIFRMGMVFFREGIVHNHYKISY